MLPYAPKPGLTLKTALVSAVLAAGTFALAGCGESKSPASVTPGSETVSKATDAAKKNAAEATQTAKKSAADATDAVKQAAADATDAAKKNAAVATENAKEMAQSAKDGAQKMVHEGATKLADATKPAHDDHAGHDHAGHDHAAETAKADAAKADAAKADAAKTTPPAAGSALNSSRGDVQKSDPAASEKGALDKALAEKAAMTKGLDPLSQDVDPNSKAKMTSEFGSDTKNFGKVMQGDVLTTKFDLQSSGEEDLVIKQAKPTCGCTVAQIMVQDPEGGMLPYQFGKPIPPGRKIEIGATLHTANKRGHAGSKINIFTNDPSGQKILSLEAEVEPFFAVNPPQIQFNQLSAKDTATDKLSIATTKGDRVKLIAGKENMPQGLKIELNPLDADAEGKATRWELVATAGPGLTEGSLAYPVALKSDLPIPGGEKLPNGNLPTYEVNATIMARVTGAMSYTPAFVSLGLIRPGQALSRTVRLTSHDAEFKMTEPKLAIQGRDTVEWDFAQYFTTVVRPVAGENAVDIEVACNGMPETLTGSFSGMLVITTGHPEKPEIKLPITGVCRGGNVAPAATPAAGTPATTPPK